MEKYLSKNFGVEAKHSSKAALQRWRDLCSVVKNSKRRFRYIADLEKRKEIEQIRSINKEKLRVALLVSKAAFHFIDAGQLSPYTYNVPDDVKSAGFGIDADELASIVDGHDIKKLRFHARVEGIADKLTTSATNGIIANGDNLKLRQKIFGFNKFDEKPPRGFWIFVWEAFQDLTLMILAVCAIVSLGVGIVTEGWPKGAYDGVGIGLSICIVVFVTAISDYRQSLQFRDLDKEKKKIFVQVTRDGYRQKVSIYDLVVGDLVHLSIGDLVPADGLFISGYSLLINESSLTGESEPVSVNKDSPFVLSGTKVQDGSANILITTVGMRTGWGKLMATLTEGGEDETPLQVKLNGVATIIGKIGLAFATVTFIVLTLRLIIEKSINHLAWSGADAVTIVNFFAIAVTIIVVAVPEGLPLAVTLSLAFAMKKMMNERALVRHLSACETMGSATCICSDKTGTLTTNHMAVVKVWICEIASKIENAREAENLRSKIPEIVLKLLFQSIFQNTGGEVVVTKEGKREILGTPTESALLELGLSLSGDFVAERRESKIVKVQPFNSAKKIMTVVVELPDGKHRAYCKGASEIVLKMCKNVVNANGEIDAMDEALSCHLMNVIDGFACEALRTLCLAFIELESSFSPEKEIPTNGYTFVAIVGIKDPVRPGVKEAVQVCKNAGILVRMVTGDNINTAKAIATECGILTEDGIAIEGPDFRVKSIEEMKNLIPKIQVMARSSPMDKHTLVKHLRTDLGEVVAVTGDGTNDAPALHEADIGLAMGIAGTEVAKESADVVILDDNFATIVNVAKWGRSVYINIQKFVQFQLTVNVVALIVNFVSACLTGTAPLTAVQLLWVNLIMDTLGALALATEPPNDELMKRMPVGRTGSFITREMWRNVIGQSIYQLIVMAVLEIEGTRLLGLHGSDAESVLNTLIFNSFVFCQVFNEINSREIEKINVLKGTFNNWIFIGVITSTVVFQIIMVQFLCNFSSTVPLDGKLWLISVLLGFLSMPIAVVIKCIPVKPKQPAQYNEYKRLPSGPDQLN
ncbi:calcium-transporting ATPase 2, plasma membrane-type isoform X3 [Cryptomeria japonica]|uniref:calcium-transporting ATPase 2, plasma membrane-type isoform X3 n=1 Tax=Cryptomeria japonica TaxID=3369 RepID=UPI0027DA1BD5|nr:calcium-transporting ATPase 2, plasma membrane-type isoform X3 [Cryptomeria japonica]